MSATRFLTPFDREILALNPIAYWKLGSWRANGTDVLFPDLSGNGNHLTSAASGSGSQLFRRDPVLRGDPHSFSFDNAQTAFRKSGTLTGWSSSFGTIMSLASIRGGASGGLFDSNPSAVGAMRLFSEDSWSTLRWDVGGSTLTTNFSKTISAIEANGIEFFTKPHLFSVNWRSAISPDTACFIDGQSQTPNAGYASRDKAPASSNFDVGSYNTTRGPVSTQAVAVFNYWVESYNQQILARLAHDARLRTPSPQLLRR